MADHQITFGRDARRYHTWSCSCGEHGDPALLRQTAKAEAMAHVKNAESTAVTAMDSELSEPLAREPGDRSTGSEP